MDLVEHWRSCTGEGEGGGEPRKLNSKRDDSGAMIAFISMLGLSTSNVSDLSEWASDRLASSLFLRMSFSREGSIVIGGRQSLRTTSFEGRSVIYVGNATSTFPSPLGVYALETKK